MVWLPVGNCPRRRKWRDVPRRLGWSSSGRTPSHGRRRDRRAVADQLQRRARAGCTRTALEMGSISRRCCRSGATSTRTHSPEPTVTLTWRFWTSVIEDDVMSGGWTARSPANAKRVAASVRDRVGECFEVRVHVRGLDRLARFEGGHGWHRHCACREQCRSHNAERSPWAVPGSGGAHGSPSVAAGDLVLQATHSRRRGATRLTAQTHIPGGSRRFGSAVLSQVNP